MHQWRTLVTVTASCVLIAGLALAQSTPPGGQPGKGSQPSGAVTPAPAKPATPMPSTPSMPSGQASDPMKGPKSTPGMVDSDVRSIQEALKSKGHDPGPIDGIMGPQTQAALNNFQKAQNLPMTGRGDAQTLDKLGVKK
jgi:peptidoglycan hydrolase-like protein with peptidoglycan-binding domain